MYATSDSQRIAFEKLTTGAVATREQADVHVHSFSTQLVLDPTRPNSCIKSTWPDPFFLSFGSEKLNVKLGLEPTNPTRPILAYWYYISWDRTQPKPWINPTHVIAIA